MWKLIFFLLEIQYAKMQIIVFLGFNAVTCNWPLISYGDECMKHLYWTALTGNVLTKLAYFHGF